MVDFMSPHPNDADRELCEFMSSSSDLGEAYAAPPGVPQPVVAALRKAFDETMQDLDYTKKLRAAKIQFNPMDGALLAQDILKTIGAPKSLVERYKAAIAGD
jgi:tripartite-type tricarboxylate transporter receptor subunit TctC